jgi:hypothetical protein
LDSRAPQTLEIRAGFVVEREANDPITVTEVRIGPSTAFMTPAGNARLVGIVVRRMLHFGSPVDARADRRPRDAVVEGARWE